MRIRATELHRKRAWNPFGHDSAIHFELGHNSAVQFMLQNQFKNGLQMQSHFI